MISVCCNLCDQDDWRVRFGATITNSNRPDVDLFRCTSASYGSHLQIVQCRNCGHVYANPRWEKEELLSAYNDVEDEVYLAERIGRERTFTRHLQKLENIIGGGNGRHLLDVGAYIGVFVEAALASGWQAIGVEPSRWAAGVAQGQGIPVIQGTLDSPELIARRFDVITMWDVIEHLDDPSSELEKAFHLLKPGGMLVVHTMDINSFFARMMGERWPWLMDMHIHYFSDRTLKMFLEKSGFEVVWSGAQGRYLTLGYLGTRISGLSQPLGRLVNGVFGRSRLKKANVLVNLGDLITVYARRPSDVRSVDAPQNKLKSMP